MGSQKRLGLMFIMVGPSGVGKNTLMNNALASMEGLSQFATATTRPMRPNEQQGREHQFISDAEFRRMIATNALVEHQEVHGQGYFYGIPRTVETRLGNGEDLIADIDVKGAALMRLLYPDNVILVFIEPPSMDVLRERMEDRGETPENIETRLKRVEMELGYAPLCDYLILNEEIQPASAMLQGIILAERSRRDLLNLRVEKDLPRHKFAYGAICIPAYDGEVLVRDEAPNFPMLLPAPGELPHETALRALYQALDGHITTASLIGQEMDGAPLTVELVEQPHFQQITFYYLCTLPERTAAPEGWGWMPCPEAPLPSKVIEACLDSQVMQK